MTRATIQSGNLPRATIEKVRPAVEEASAQLPADPKDAAGSALAVRTLLDVFRRVAVLKSGAMPNRDEVLTTMAKAGRIAATELNAASAALSDAAANCLAKLESLPPALSPRLMVRMHEIVGSLAQHAQPQLEQTRAAAVHLQAAATAMDTAADIRDAQRNMVCGYVQHDIDAYPLERFEDMCSKPEKLEQVAKELSAFIGMAGAHGAGQVHNGYVSYELDGTVLTPERTSDVNGHKGVRGRPHMVDFGELQERALDGDPMTGLVDPADVGLYHEVVWMNLQGIRNGGLALVDAISGPEGEIISSGEGDAYREQALRKTAHFESTTPTHSLSDDTRLYLRRTAAELQMAWETYDHAPEKGVDWTKFPLAHRALAATHDRWVQANPAIAGPADLKTFDAQTPRDQARNIASVLFAIDSTLKVEATVQSVIKHGVLDDDGVSASAALLQLHLVASTRGARAVLENQKLPTDERFDAANKIQARAVADQASILTARWVSPTPQEQVGALHDVMYRASLRAGEAFKPNADGSKVPGASAAPAIAIEATKEALASIWPKKTPEEREEILHRALHRSTIDDVAEFADVQFHRKTTARGPELVEAFRAETPTDDYFYKDLDTLPVRQVADNDLSGDPDAKLALGLLLRMANVTWISGQTFRASSEDMSRASPYDRGAVFNPYEILVGSAGTDVEAVFAVVKDLLVLQKTAGLRP